MGDLFRQYSVIQAGWSVVSCSHSACLTFCGGRGNVSTRARQMLHPAQDELAPVTRSCVQLLLKRATIPSS